MWFWIEICMKYFISQHLYIPVEFTLIGNSFIQLIFKLQLSEKEKKRMQLCFLNSIVNFRLR